MNRRDAKAQRKISTWSFLSIYVYIRPFAVKFLFLTLLTSDSAVKFTLWNWM